jgi:hypothetical protein
MSSTAAYREHGHGSAIAPPDDKTVSINLVRTAAVTLRLFGCGHGGRQPRLDVTGRQNLASA